MAQSSVSTLPKRWLLAQAAPPDILSHYGGMHPILAQVLYNRGFTDPFKAEDFLRAPNGTVNPFQMKGVNQAVGRIRQAIKNREQIIIYGDFDADGVTSTMLLMQTLTALGAQVKPYIPHRVDEGYGLNSAALLKLARAGVKLVITVDCGIRSVDEVADGTAAGLDIIVTDHHSIGPEIPRAYAVVNPKQTDCKYPEDMLAGVGVAYRLAQALLTAAAGTDKRNIPLETDDLLDLVAIGTVADLAPLDRAENRILVREGLKALNSSRRPGLRALMEVAGLKSGAIDAMSIGFGIGPRINAAGRLESAMTAYHLLAAQTESEAVELAHTLQGLNTQRQDLTRAAQEVFRQQVMAADTTAPLIFASDKHIQPGIVGLVAGRLTEEFYRPTVILHEDGDESRASCRSIVEFDITAALDQCADLLVRHGGHAQAAGFTVANQNLPALREKLTGLAAEQLGGRDLRPSLTVDVDAPLGSLSLEVVAALAQLEPTGHHNPSPTLMTRDVRVLEKRTVGKEGQHLKLKVIRPGVPPLDAIGFNLGSRLNGLPDRIDVAYQLEINEWNGNRSLQLHLLDVRPVED
jgi:single-stranded-DNA-specific exonuclease